MDQETAVFSVRDAAGEDPDTGAAAPDPDAGDERLRAAVAAWVAGDGGSADPSASANSDDAEAEAAPATGDTEDDGEPAADAKGGEAGAGAKGDAERAVEADEASASKTGSESDAEPEADSTSDGKADAKSADEADAKSGGKAPAKAGSASDAKADGTSDAEPTAEADAEADGKSAPDADGPSDAKPADAEADVKSVPEADDASDGKPSAKADVKADGEKSDAEPADEADGPSDAKPGAKPADAKSDGKSAPDAKPDDKPADAKADAKSASVGASASDAEPDAKADPKPADPKPDGKSDAKSGPKPDAKSDGKSDAKADAEADGKSAPGAGAGAGREGGVDQATAVFKAVPQPVDQPTTTLKAAGTAQSSKFVPLKSLDEGRATGKELPPEAEQPTVEPAERTTQQPLPPKPPLDLLAELTNTPPPPETRVRTAVRRVKVWTPIVILLIVVFGVIQAVRPLPTPSLSLTADSTYSFDGDKASLPWPGEGQGWMDVQGIGTMDNFGKQTPVPIGSVAKSMTAYIVLKDHPLKAGADGPSINIDATAEKEGGYDADGQNESTLNTVKEGDKISQKDALAAVMIPSANNIARLLARWDAGSEEAFVKKMNATAKKLGMKNTTYTDPSGLKESTVSTAEDQVKLGNELVQIPALTDITKLPTWTDPSGKKWTNYNRLVPYDGAIGIKTGTTTKAGGNLLFAATKDAGGSTVTVVGAVLGQHKAPIIDTVNAVSKTAMLAAQDAVTSSTVLKKGDVVGYVDDQLGGHTPVTVTKDVKAVGWAGKTVHLQLADQDGKSVSHTGKAGETVGVLEVGDGEGGAVEVPVALQKGLTEPGFGAKLTRVG
ncbi:D-alanyl-D-alanine carboxypeptidase [Streptomyces sp. BH104]|uniref:D-alanyl-D-alanine carboxypeptidase n=1 Tax=Streptomyces sp. BH104 TaxID=3410407 RepID=UPI003BB5D5D6